KKAMMPHTAGGSVCSVSTGGGVKWGRPALGSAAPGGEPVACGGTPCAGSDDSCACGDARSAERFKSSGLLILPIGVVRMFQIPKGSAAMYHGNCIKVVDRWRRRRRPLQGIGIPGIIARGLPMLQRPQQVPYEYHKARRLDESA